MFVYIGSIEVQMTLEQARSASHPGNCDEDVKYLSQVPAIARQLRKIDAAELSSALSEYGAWDAEQLADHDENLQRLVWIAAVDIVEEQYEKTRNQERKSL